VHFGLGHDNSFSPLFLAAPAPGAIPGSTGPPALPQRQAPEHLPGGMAPGTRRHSGPRAPRWPTQPNAKNTNLVNP
jgi:hypothetical protein